MKKTMPSIFIKQLALFLSKASAVILLFYTSTSCALAAQTGLPWETPLQKILDSLTGPVAKILGVISIVIAGLGIAFGESGSGTKRIFQIVLGLSIAFTASTLVVTLFGFSGGAAF